MQHPRRHNIPYVVSLLTKLNLKLILENWEAFYKIVDHYSSKVSQSQKETLRTLRDRDMCLSLAFLMKKHTPEPSPSFLFLTLKMFTTVIVPIFQNVKIKEKSFVIPVHLLSKYTVIRASYVIWQ